MPLIQLVFAYEEDTYYCDNLMKLSLDQYLEMDLLRSFQDVSFLERNDSNAVWKYRDTRGRVKRESYRINKHLFRDILTDVRQERHAVICKLKDFCALFNNSDCCRQFNEINSATLPGTIILKCPPVVEEIRQQLSADCAILRCDNALNDTFGCDNRDFFVDLSRRKIGACRFLNTFSETQITALLLHLMWQHPERYEGEEHFKRTAKFLTHYLNNEEMQHRFQLFMGPQQNVLITHRFQDLYLILEDEQEWARMQTKLSEELRSREGDLSGYLRAKGYVNIDASRYSVYVTHAPESCFSRFAMSYVRSFVPNTPEEDTAAQKNTENGAAPKKDPLSDIKQQAAELFSLIRAASIRNENPEIMSAFDTLLQKYENAGTDDATRRRLMKVMRFCAECIYTQDAKELENIGKVIKCTNDYIAASIARERCNSSYLEFKRMRDQQTNRNTVEAVMLQKELEQAKQKLDAHSNRLKGYDELIESFIFRHWEHQAAWNPEWGSIANELDAGLERIEQEFEQQNQNALDLSMLSTTIPSTATPPAAPPPKEKADEQPLDLSMLSMTIPNP